MIHLKLIQLQHAVYTCKICTYKFQIQIWILIVYLIPIPTNCLHNSEKIYFILNCAQPWSANRTQNLTHRWFPCKWFVSVQLLQTTICKQIWTLYFKCPLLQRLDYCTFSPKTLISSYKRNHFDQSSVNPACRKRRRFVHLWRIRLPEYLDPPDPTMTSPLLQLK